jgi:predicted restriction endonuclease
MSKSLEQEIKEIENRRKERALRKGSTSLIELPSSIKFTQSVKKAGNAPQTYKEAKDLYNTKEYNEWRQIIFLRDGHQCQLCGKVGGALEVHHIRPKKNFPHLTLESTNGVVLCQLCHQTRVTNYEARFFFIFDKVVKWNTRSR